MTSSTYHISKIFLKTVLLTMGVLTIPLIAMQFTFEVQWTFLDFVLMAMLAASTVSSYLIAAHVFPKYRISLLTFISCCFLLIWAEMAVGVVTRLFT